MNNSATLPQWALDSHPPSHQPRSQRTHSGLVVQLNPRRMCTGAALLRLKKATREPRVLRWLWGKHFLAEANWLPKINPWTCVKFNKHAYTLMGRVVDGTLAGLENVFCWFAGFAQLNANMMQNEIRAQQSYWKLQNVQLDLKTLTQIDY